MGAAHYRFLPWARRGLSAVISNEDGGGALPPRGTVSAGLTVSNAGSHGVNLAMYGPGDIIGLDPRQIIRSEPRPNSTDSEPNYLAAIEFDNPELPWLFTPARANSQDRLRPWLVLVVVETSGADRVATPAVERARPLPFILLSAAQVSRQLPDLEQSWAWAHSQLMVEQGVTARTWEADVAALGDDPDLNLSRIICPTRLKPMTSYMACLVPAFDQGRVRGLGGTPDAAATLAPAWKPLEPADLILPVYFHWDFATGPEGDFESLASELKPSKPPPGIGTAPMYIWDALPGLMGAVDANIRNKPVVMDGALRATKGAPTHTNDIDGSFQVAMSAEVNAPAVIAADGKDTAKAIAAPLYGGFHANASRVQVGVPKWLRELNLDPRARAAAGLGAAVVRANQEDYMQAAWEQVGKVLEANALLNQGRLAAEALDRLHTRFKTLPAARQLAMMQPLQTRVKMADLTIDAAVARSSLPDASLSPQYRRLASTRRPAVRVAARRAGLSPYVGLVERMAPGRASVDPNDFTPDGITALRGMDAIAAVQNSAAQIDLAPLGIAATITGAQVKQLQDSVQDLAGSVPINPVLALRGNLAITGLVTGAHIAALEKVADAVTGSGTGAMTMTALISAMITEVELAPRSRAVLMEVNNGAAVGTAIDLASDGRIVARTARGQPERVIGTLGAGVARDGNLAASLRPLAVGMLGGSVPAAIAVDGQGRMAVRDLQGAPGAMAGARKPAGFGRLVDMLVKDAPVVDRFRNSFALMVDTLQVNVLAPALQLVPFNMAAAATAAAARLNPRVTVAARLATMVQVNGSDLAGGIRAGIRVPATTDRIMAAPELPEPAYIRLAAMDREAFLPGADTIPPNTITLLETNPRFIEAFMIGLNHEMNRELLWRSYPTDQRGTPFRYFWDWEDGKPDIAPIHSFPAGRQLGQNTRSGSGGAEPGGNLVLLVRGSLLRRYPNSTIMAWKAERPLRGKRVLKPNPGPGDLAMPAFFGSFAPDISFAGFSLTRADIMADEGWFFVIQQQVTEPRFGFDEEADGAAAARPGNWLNAKWIDTGTLPGGHLNMAGLLANHTANSVQYGKDAAHLAAVTLQRPFRLAVHASHLAKL